MRHLSIGPDIRCQVRRQAERDPALLPFLSNTLPAYPSADPSAYSPQMLVLLASPNRAERLTQRGFVYQPLFRTVSSSHPTTICADFLSLSSLLIVDFALITLGLPVSLLKAALSAPLLRARDLNLPSSSPDLEYQHEFNTSSTPA